MPLRPNAFADDHRIRALSITLRMTLDQVNTAFAAYAPRDTVEAAMVEQILVLQHNLHQATRRAEHPDLPVLLADRLCRTVCVLTRQLDRVAERLEKRQWHSASLLPQQYWRDVPIAPVGPYDESQAVVAEPAPSAPEPQPPGMRIPDEAVSDAEPSEEPVRRFDLDDPRAAGDALHQLLRMRIPAGADPAKIWAAAERDAALIAANHGSGSPRGHHAV